MFRTSGLEQGAAQGPVMESTDNLQPARSPSLPCRAGSSLNPYPGHTHRGEWSFLSHQVSPQEEDTTGLLPAPPLGSCWCVSRPSCPTMYLGGSLLTQRRLLLSTPSPSKAQKSVSVKGSGVCPCHLFPCHPELAGKHKMTAAIHVLHHS